jgi:anti-anti-sigma factor
MRLTELMNSLLENVYTCFSHAISEGAPDREKTFYDAIILQALNSTPFRKRLLDDPVAVLNELGMVLPEGMTRVSFMGSAGLAVLLSTQKRLSKNGQQLFLCEVPEPIRNLFKLAGLEGLFKFVGNNMKHLWWTAFAAF